MPRFLSFRARCMAGVGIRFREKDGIGLSYIRRGELISPALVFFAVNGSLPDYRFAPEGSQRKRQNNLPILSTLRYRVLFLRFRTDL